MLRSVMLTWKIHRFEVIFAALVIAVVGVAIWWVSSQLLDLGLSDTCWPRDEDGNFPSAECDGLMSSFWNTMSGQGGYARIALTVAPSIIGLILGVPIVARELELRTTSLAWSLSLRRSRWLLARALPMFVIGLVGFIVLGWVGSGLFEAMQGGRQGPDLTEVAASGPALVARGVLAVAIGLLAGALIGRTMPALVIAVVLMLAWSLVVVPQIQNVLTQDRAVWVNNQGDYWRDGTSYMAYAEFGNFYESKPGLPGEPGARYDDEDWNAAVEEGCGPTPDYGDEDGEGTPAFRAWARCSEDYPYPTSWFKGVPESAFPDYQMVDILASLGLAALCFLVTIPVVERRRSS